MPSVTLRSGLRGVICVIMSNNKPSPENSDPQKSVRNSGSDPGPGASPRDELQSKKPEQHYSDIQSAIRFPVRLPISVKSQSGESYTESQNISSNGVLFQMDSDMPVGSMVDFTISLPANIVGADADVQLDCRGRVVRSSDDGGRRGVGVVIDEYRFDRR